MLKVKTRRYHSEWGLFGGPKVRVLKFLGVTLFKWRAR